MKQLPDSVRDFKFIVTEHHFVDKTKFLSALVRRGIYVLMLLRPSGFGKSTNLSMIKYFFDIQSTEEEKALFKNLEVAKDPEVYAKAFSHPVLLLNLGSRCDSFSDCINVYSIRMRELYEKHSYLLDSDNMTDYDRNKFQTILNGTKDELHLESALSNLMHYLRNHYQKRVITLIDEYDSLLMSSYYNGYFKECRQFMQSVYIRTFKSSHDLKFGILAGQEKISMANDFGGFNNMEDDNVFSSMYSQYFGYTEDEVKKLLHDYDAEDKFDSLKSWYGGYNIDDISMYPSASVNQYINSGFKNSYYINQRQNNGDLISAFKKANINNIEYSLKMFTKEETHYKIYNFLSDNEFFINNDYTMTILLNSGYLTFKTSSDYCFSKRCNLVIPNKETGFCLRDELIRKIFDDNYSDIYQSLRTIQDYDEASIIHNLEYIFSLYSKKLNSELFEYKYTNIYQLLVFLFYLTHTKKAKNPLVLFPKAASDPALIFEFEPNKEELEDISEIISETQENKTILKFKISFTEKNVRFTKM